MGAEGGRPDRAEEVAGGGALSSVPGDQPAGSGLVQPVRGPVPAGGGRSADRAVVRGPWAPAPELAGSWPRIGARLLDALLVGLVVGVVGGLLGLPDNVGLLLTLVAMIGYETLMLRW
jgi:hypothetical protein